MIFNQKMISYVGMKNLTNRTLQFRIFMAKCDMNNLGFSDSSFTWNNMQEGKKNIQEKVDRFMGDQNWKNLVTKKLATWVSMVRIIAAPP